MLKFKIIFFLISFGNFVSKVFKLFFGKTISPINSQTIIQTAIKNANFDDFGEEFDMERFKLLITPWERDVDLTLLGRKTLTRQHTDRLTMKLKIEKEIKEHPEILEVPIVKPLFVVGFMRTGSTYLQNLLALDQNGKGNRTIVNPDSSALFLAPKMYELYNPSPPIDDTDLRDPRIKATQDSLDFFFYLLPGFKIAHFSEAMSPEECHHLFEHNAVDRIQPIFKNGGMKDYIDNLYSKNSDSSKQIYISYKKELQLLLSENYKANKKIRHLVLKDTLHMSFLDTLLDVFPDCCIINTHRSPEKVIPSNCSAMFEVSKMYYEESSVNKESLGKSVVESCKLSEELMLDSRQKLPKEKFFDCNYDQFIENPIKMIQNIYEYFGYDFTSEFEEKLKVYIENDRNKRRMVHNYNEKDFGINKEELRSTFKNYCNTFKV